MVVEARAKQDTTATTLAKVAHACRCNKVSAEADCGVCGGYTVSLAMLGWFTMRAGQMMLPDVLEFEYSIENCSEKGFRDVEFYSYQPVSYLLQSNRLSNHCSE